MSVAFTEQAVIERRKTVTRRKGWWLDKHGRRLLVPGDRLTLCRKVMGRKAGEPLVRLAEVEVVDVCRQTLARLHESSPWVESEMAAEGFPCLDGKEFVRRYFVEAQGLTSWAMVTRIEWRYLDSKEQLR
jgi:hypothetical protein